MPTFSRPAAHSARTPTRQDVNDETAALPGLFAKVTKGERRRHNASGNGLGAALARLRADLLLLHADIDFVRVARPCTAEPTVHPHQPCENQT